LTELLVLATPYPRLVTQGVRTDFEGILSLLTRVNQILEAGFSPDEIGQSFGTDLNFNGFDLGYHLHNYHRIVHARDLSSLFLGSQGSQAFAFGNIVGLSIANASQSLVDGAISSCRHQDLDYWMKNILGQRLLSSIFESYVGDKSLSQASDGFPLSLSVILTTFLCIVLCNNAEFNTYLEKLEELGLRKIPNINVLIGKNGASNFIEPDFPGISANPVIIDISQNFQADHTYADIINGVIYTTLVIGELYNMQGVVEDLLEMILVSEPEVEDELSKLGRLRNPFNPKYLFKIFNIRDLNEYQESFGSVLRSSIANIRRYRTVSGNIFWKQEGIHHYDQVVELLTLLDSYSVYVGDKIIVSTAGPRWILNISTAFFGERRLFDNLKEPVRDLTTLIQNSLEQARTTISLNITVAALAWTVAITVIGPLFSPLILSSVTNLFSRTELWLIVFGLGILYFTGPLKTLARLAISSVRWVHKIGVPSRLNGSPISKLIVRFLVALGLALLVLAGRILLGSTQILAPAVALALSIGIGAVASVAVISYVFRRILSWMRRANR
jgi:hypothetical protein